MIKDDILHDNIQIIGCWLLPKVMLCTLWRLNIPSLLHWWNKPRWRLLWLKVSWPFLHLLTLPLTNSRLISLMMMLRMLSGTTSLTLPSAVPQSWDLQDSSTREESDLIWETLFPSTDPMVETSLPIKLQSLGKVLFHIILHFYIKTFLPDVIKLQQMVLCTQWILLFCPGILKWRRRRKHGEPFSCKSQQNNEIKKTFWMFAFLLFG